MAAVVKKLGSILTEVTKSGKSIATYWGVGIDGSKIEEIGEFDKDDWSKASIQGPKVEKWGLGTKLLPAILYIVEDVALNSDLTIGVILTDGIIEDEEDCIDYCFKVGKKYVGKIPPPIKLFLIGIGENVDEGQLERFDNMFEGTGIDYDLFASCYVSDMQDDADILNCLFAQLIDPYALIAPNGRVEDAKGKILISWNYGMPDKFEFILPKGDKQFTIKAPGMEIVQDVSEVIS